MLRLKGRKVVVVGGGSVARRRVMGLLACGANVTVVAPEVCPEIEKTGVRIERRPYHTGDLRGAKVVVIATDDTAVNAAVQHDAERAGVLVNRTDDPEAGDLMVMAHARRGPLTVAVATGGISAKAAAVIRDELLAGLNEQWVAFLEALEPLRAEVQANVKDTPRRQELLKRMADPRAMEIFKRKGDEGLREWIGKDIGNYP